MTCENPLVRMKIFIKIRTRGEKNEKNCVFFRSDEKHFAGRKG